MWLSLQPASGLTPPTGSQDQCHLAAQSQDRFLQSSHLPRARKRTSTTEGRIGASTANVLRFRAHLVRMPTEPPHTPESPSYSAYVSSIFHYHIRRTHPMQPVADPVSQVKSKTIEQKFNCHFYVFRMRNPRTVSLVFPDLARTLIPTVTQISPGTEPAPSAFSWRSISYPLWSLSVFTPLLVVGAELCNFHAVVLSP